MAVSGSAWPALDMKEVYRVLTAPGAPFEMQEIAVRGVPIRTYVNAPRDLRTFFEIGRAWGPREFLVYGDERQTFGQHFRAAGNLGRILSEQFGVCAGDRVAIAMRNLPEWSLAFWAAASIGAVITPLNAWGTGEELTYGVLDSGAKVVFADTSRHERLLPHREDIADATIITVRSEGDAKPAGAIRLEDLIGMPAGYDSLPDDPLANPNVDVDSPAAIIYTSGTTGRPKGAICTHRNLTNSLLNVSFTKARAALRRGEPIPVSNPQDPQKCAIVPVPFFHISGISGLLIPCVASGAKLVLMHKWDAERFLSLIEQERVTSTMCVPAMVWQVLDSPNIDKYDLSSMESFAYGGAAVAPELIERFAARFPAIPPGQAYGATETTASSISVSAEDYIAQPDSVGLPMPCVDIKIIDTNGQEVAPGEAGEILLRGPNVAQGYWNRPEESNEAFAEGWYHTGDIGRADGQGRVYLLDRAKDMLIRGGENIYSIEIESVLLTHKDVMEAAVLGLPHKVLGEEVGAVVRVRGDAIVAQEELQRHVSEHLAQFKVPVLIDIRTEELPRNASGKTLKRHLRDELVKGR